VASCEENIPNSLASSADNILAEKISSLALETPNSRVARCVPPAPGIIPSLTSGRPIFVTDCPWK
jgi:hypothetical protein